jgi:hypothetical protein
MRVCVWGGGGGGGAWWGQQRERDREDCSAQQVIDTSKVAYGVVATPFWACFVVPYAV